MYQNGTIYMGGIEKNIFFEKKAAANGCVRVTNNPNFFDPTLANFSMGPDSMPLLSGILEKPISISAPETLREAKLLSGPSTKKQFKPLVHGSKFP